MVIVHSRILSLGIFILEILWLLLAQVTGNMLLLLPCLACFLFMAVWYAFRGMAFPFLLFFLPFSPLIKIQPGTTSFYTIALLIILLIFTLRGSKNIKILHFIPALGLIGFSLIVKLAWGYAIENSYVLFSALIILFPFIKCELFQKYDFFWLTIYFTYGVAAASLLARGFVGFSTISRYYINIHEYTGIVRFSGFYGDPNFYSAHITAALAGILVMLLYRTTKTRFVVHVISIILLAFCGFMSVSKSFVLILATMMLLWVLAILYMKQRISVKITVFFSCCIGVMLLLSITAFSDMIDMMISRFSEGKTLSDLTTGRLELWLNYILAFMQSPALFFFGQGGTDVLVGGRASHNTIIQSIYQFGLLGSVTIISWIIIVSRNVITDIKVKGSDYIPVLILLAGAIGPWMGLDLLFFDEFFLLPMYLWLGIVYISKDAQSSVDN